MPHIFGTGLVALDLIVEHRPGGQTLSASGGGTCGNVLAILAHMGWTSSWLGAVEPSAAGYILRTEMQNAGVDLGTVAECNSSPVPIFAHHVRRSDSDELLHHWFSNECPYCTKALPKYSSPTDSWLRSQSHHLDQADIFFVDRLSAGTLDLAAHAHQNGALVVYEPSVSSDAPWIDDMLTIADIVKYSHDRIAALGENWRTSTAIRALCIETRGREGLRWSRGNQIGDFGVLPSVRNPLAIDACGAGDWFTSAFLFGVAKSKTKPSDLGESELTKVLEAASRLAAWSCGYLGARGGLYDASTREIFNQIRMSPNFPTHERTPLQRPLPVGYSCTWCPSTIYC